ncbi:MAG: HAMP domain-containing histidine kinase [Candidatus Pacebacteria bacterium]|nr:HAMP domain-containing histidine kinase [Candidatus Paceibacterota bacterium]
MICQGLTQPFLFLFSADVPPLLYYSHIPSAIISLLLGILILKLGDKRKSSIILFFLTMNFFLLFITNIAIWTNIDAGLLTFLWSINQFIFLLLPILSLYLFAVFLNKDLILPLPHKIFGLLTAFLFLPIIWFGYNINYFDLYNCEAVEGKLVTFYQNGILLASTFIIVISSIRRLVSIKEKREEKIKIILLAFGLCSMLFSLFFSWNPAIFGYSFAAEQFGFVGMIIFLLIISYLIVKFKAFSVKLLATQALVWGLSALIGSQFFFIKVTTNFILNGIGFIASIVLGRYLVLSVKKEVQQKEELAKLDVELENLLKERESLVHLVTHKVKGSFTRSKYIFAGILDGTYGEINPEIKKVAGQGLESDNAGIETVDLVLSVANMQKGTVRYDMKPLNLKDLVEKNISDKKIAIEAHGLKIETDIKESVYQVLGDAFWLKEAVANLIENSIKYTPTGTIVVGLEKKEKNIVLFVKDTGIGINDEDKKSLFTEGGRGKNSVKVNVDSTGYGLYSVKLIIDAHKGRTWAESEGTGKGSTFFVELPIA